MPCPTCTRLDRDEELLRSAVAEREEALRYDLPGELRDLIENEELALEDLLARILEHRTGV